MRAEGTEDHACARGDLTPQIEVVARQRWASYAGPLRQPETPPDSLSEESPRLPPEGATQMVLEWTSRRPERPSTFHG